ncbi:MAG: His/Gly/Thr/Pro-type tRNA ligase C-terminal domain-containing protein [Lawsonibacter sp.]
MTDDLSPAIALATQLREAGIRTQIHGEQKKFKQKISYADKLSIPYAVFLGEDEILRRGRCQGPGHRRAGEALPPTPSPTSRPG